MMNAHTRRGTGNEIDSTNNRPRTANSEYQNMLGTSLTPGGCRRRRGARRIAACSRCRQRRQRSVTRDCPVTRHHSRCSYTASMLTSVTAGPYTIRGVSVGGVYTSIAVPELGVVFDCGIAPRSHGGIDTILLSHGHADHVGALPALLGIRALHGKTKPPRVLMPAEIVDDLKIALAAMTKLQRWPIEIEAIGVEPGQEIPLRGDLVVRAVRTFHPVPSLGYLLVRKVAKLLPQFIGRDGGEIAMR